MRALFPVLVLLTFAGVPACATRTSNHTVVENNVVQIDLRSQKPLFGFKAIEKGYAQPIDISPARIEAILAGIQIDIRPSDDSAIRERRYAIPKKVLPKVADGMSRAFAEASPDQELVVLALRKQMQKGFFNRKYLTSLIATVQGDEMVILLSRVDWKTEEHRRGSKLPFPEADRIVMPFATVPTERYTTVGQQGVKVKWQSETFGPAAIEENVAGGRSGAAPDEPTVAGASEATSASEPAGAAPTPVEATVGVVGASIEIVEDEVAIGADALRGLTPDVLRKLADLEEERVSGSIDVGEYEIRRRAILDGKP